MAKVLLVERNDLKRLKTTSCCSTGVHIVIHSVNSQTVYVTVFEYYLNSFFYLLSGCFKATVPSLVEEQPHLTEVYHCTAIVLTRWSPRDS